MDTLRLSLEPTEKTHRLTLTAPNDAITADVEQLGDRQKLGARTFLDDGETSSWGLNARVVGRQRHQPDRRESLARIHKCIAAIRSHADNDETMSIVNYRTLAISEYFDVEIDIYRPQSEGVTAQKQSVAAMREIATDLGHPLAEGYPRTDYEDEYIGLSLARFSTLRTTEGSALRRQQRINLVGNNIANNAEPLIYLAGAVALAHAGEQREQAE